jgi:O-antigen/teichoic acid export membrane protein
LTNPAAGGEVGVVALFVFFTGLNSYQIGVVMGLDALRGYAKSSVAQGLISVAVVVGMGYMAGARGALAGLSLAAAVRWALTSVVVSRALRHHRIHLRAKGASHDTAEVVRFSLPASLNAFTYMGALWVVATALVRQPDGLILSALYAVSMNIKTLVLFAPHQANSMSVVYLTRYRFSDAAAYRNEFLLNMLMMFTVALVAAGMAGVLAPHIMSLYGESFSAGVGLLRVLMISAVAEAVGYGLTQHYSSRGAMWTVLLAASVPRDLIVVVAAIGFLPAYGVTTIGWAYTVSWLVYSAMLLALSRRVR